ncbi:CRP/FNR family transcriptional regulator, nitrogen fixation regulation protein [Tardiphaga sp. OK246]|jgi:CRP/FNR family nitrogen fixation transcriptional regulator|uniref:helix-turn-helix domain-containing protein n=1 Tax=Tardiphaga sp. OK246 TaxID=1855307 RepID=UPI000B6A45A5|nr:helix-turn-helix domain-containing protein [Tardiphaga sp. OK246]SNT43405.1 CRP/FNR family transcriptional regulator, nitrogen fixation regulation protein [Tardiphaga sp. OK246]
MLSQTTHAAILPLLPYEVLSQPQQVRRLHLGATRCYARNAEIFGEDEPATHIYRVVSGAIRTYRILHDGRRQITAFYLPGDLFGFEAGSNHLNSAEAICESQISAISLNTASRPMAGSPDPTSDLWSMVKEELRRMQDHMVLLVRSAEERVAHFLLEMSRRSGNLATVNLQMSRQDIADYLGITIETVSRTLTHFEQAGLISLRTSRQINLCKRAALARLNA